MSEVILPLEATIDEDLQLILETKFGNGRLTLTDILLLQICRKLDKLNGEETDV
ncbi:MAG: hypothetical protein HOG49_12960 [Candidatus Scalindua sp.]|nr:hypothetical protein [Candidatus Scalindua sp.]